MLRSLRGFIKVLFDFKELPMRYKSVPGGFKVFSERFRSASVALITCHGRSDTP